jgi:hypothetical protein
MKISVACFVLLFFCRMGYAQQMPESFLSMLPNPPGGICDEAVGENPAKKAFIEKVNDIDHQLDEEILKRRDKVENKMEGSEEQMMKNAMARTGVSPELMQQLMALQKQSKGATGNQAKAYNDQKKALAGQMMEQSMNMSMGEIENLKNFDKEGKKAWAEAYATEKKAEVMADPKAYRDKNAKLMKDVKLVQKQQHLADSLGSQAIKYMRQFAELDSSREAVDALVQIKHEEEVLNEMYKQSSPNNQAIASQVDRIRSMQINYCNMQTSRYVAILSNYKVFLQASLSHYYRLEKMTNQVTAQQTGIDFQPEPGLMGLEQVRDYLQKLSNVYQYNQIRPAAVFMGAQ